MPEGLFFALFAASVQQHYCWGKKMHDTATREGINEEKERLLTSSWNPPISGINNYLL